MEKKSRWPSINIKNTILIVVALFSFEYLKKYSAEQAAKKPTIHYRYFMDDTTIGCKNQTDLDIVKDAAMDLIRKGRCFPLIKNSEVVIEEIALLSPQKKVRLKNNADAYWVYNDRILQIPEDLMRNAPERDR